MILYTGYGKAVEADFAATRAVAVIHDYSCGAVERFPMRAGEDAAQTLTRCIGGAPCTYVVERLHVECPATKIPDEGEERRWPAGAC